MIFIKNYENRYSITSDGKIFTHLNNRFKGLRKHRNGYVEVELSKNKSNKVFYVHRLVAEHFIGSVDNMQVNHIDGNKSNNNVSNLEIVTAKHNQQHSVLNGLFRKTQKRGSDGRFIKSEVV